MEKFSPTEIEKAMARRVPAGELTAEKVAEQEIIVSGWVYRYRDQGGVLFVDLRERSGILQVVFDRAVSESLLQMADALRSEDVILVSGRLRNRAKEAVNPKLATGEVELLASRLAVISKSKPSPIPLEEFDEETAEENRLKFRFLDLRRTPMQTALRSRHKFMTWIRNWFDRNGFWEVETPILNKSTPEGARDFLVPSRLNPGEFYALPQSPQIFKQILMIGQTERYYQIARCFRDEDLRKDRQPEFTQIDVEMSFISQEMIMQHMADMITSSLREVFDLNVSAEVPRISYHDALERYGNDKPDIRFGMELIELGEWAATTEFQVFKKAVENGGRVKGLCVPGGAALSRKDIDELTKWVAQDFKAKGLAWVKVAGNTLESVVTKFLPEDSQKKLIELSQAKDGDIIFFAADSASVVFPTMAALRLHLGAKFKLIPEDQYKALWVVDFPLFEYDPESKSVISLHHPFTAPVAESIEVVTRLGKKSSRDLNAEEIKELLAVKSNAYDFVLNGNEIGGGSIRIHDQNLQSCVFRLLNISDEEANERFGFLLTALQYGAPPHGGIAFGVDRVLMIALQRNSIRDVMAFPKTQKGLCLMSEAPSSVDEKQLRELYLRSVVPKKEGAEKA